MYISRTSTYSVEAGDVWEGERGTSKIPSRLSLRVPRGERGIVIVGSGQVEADDIEKIKLAGHRD